MIEFRGDEVLNKPKPIVKKTILRVHGRVDQGLRVGKGFSIGELKAAGLKLEEARKLGLWIDKKRRSIHEWNVKVLKEYLKSLGK